MAANIQEINRWQDRSAELRQLASDLCVKGQPVSKTIAAYKKRNPSYANWTADEQDYLKRYIKAANGV